MYHLAQNGFENSVATLGASLSDEQAAILAGTGRRLILMYDGEEAGQKGARRAAAKLITQAFVRAVKLAPGTEPDSLSAEELRSIIP